MTLHDIAIPLFVAGWLICAGLSFFLLGLIGAILYPKEDNVPSAKRVLLFWPVLLLMGVALLIVHVFVHRKRG